MTGNFGEAFHAAVAALERLQRLAAEGQHAATLIESSQAISNLIDALEFDDAEADE